jgi:hypothetical protein
MADVERLLESQGYAVGREVLKIAEPFDRWARRLRWSIGPFARRMLGGDVARASRS